jgi:hypothetical protein
LIFTLKYFVQLTFALIYPNIKHFNLKSILTRINSRHSRTKDTKLQKQWSHMHLYHSWPHEDFVFFLSFIFFFLQNHGDLLIDKENEINFLPNYQWLSSYQCFILFMNNNRKNYAPHDNYSSWLYRMSIGSFLATTILFSYVSIIWVVSAASCNN